MCNCNKAKQMCNCGMRLQAGSCRLPACDKEPPDC